MPAQRDGDLIGRVVPRRLGPYELVARVGQGAMGWVFKARRDDGRVVALKVLSPRVIRDQASVERFFREARAAALLNHPNIVPALEAGQEGGFYFIAMEFVEGESLRSALRRGPLSEERALAIAAEVAKALDHAHRSGIVHRDIKPDNILLARDGRVRVTDFGLAKAVGKKIDPDARRFLGTPAYTSPEQIRSEPNIDSRADIFSLGVTLFEMLTGQLPFAGVNPVAIAAAVLSEPLPSVRRLRPELSIATARLVERMTAKDPAQRFSSPAELLKAIATAADAARSQAARAPARSVRPRRRRSMAPTYVAIVLVLAANAAVLLFLYPRLTRRRHHQAPSSSRVATTSAVTSTTVVQPSKAALAELMRAVGAVSDFRRRNPRAYASAEKRLDSLIKRYPPERLLNLPPEGRQAVEELKRLLATVRSEGAGAAQRELLARESRARELLKQGEIDPALALLETFPKELEVQSISAKLEAARDKLRLRAEEVFEARGAAAQQLLKEGRREQARAIYQKYADCRVAQIASRAREALAAIDEAIAEEKARAEREAALLYRTVAQKVLNLLAVRDYKEADRILVEAVVDPKLKDHREGLKDLQWLGRAAAEVWANVGFGLRKLKPGEPLRVGGIACQFVSFDGDTLRVKFGDISATRTLNDLTNADLVALAIRGYGALTPAREVRISLFLLAERDYEGARRRLEAAKAKGADVTRALDLLGRLSKRICPTCGGARLIPCPKCAGRGYLKKEKVQCPACGGRGSLACRRCRGQGRIKCTNCGGSGRIGELPCGVCGGTGWERCPDCGGDGRIRCLRCDGRGFLIRTIPCPTCEGKGKITCPQCKGRGTLAPAELKPAPAAKTP